ncbi:cytochrome P450 704C1-like [Prosopis cineraria]|uniref:cytochrome P450 704C1-like n=1 Tax=Prosopis cineraria TaxID=364024 RepID=UPI0024107F18|nr:cytochrome P450 704C1-like [Prosopis cineraria]
MDLLFVLSSLVLFALVSLSFAAIVIKIHGRRLSNKKRRYHPVAGTVLDHLFNYHKLLDFITERTRQRKTYRMLSFLRAEVYTADPVNIEHFLAGNFTNYGKGWYHHSVLSDLLGDGIFTVDGVKWKHQRKAASYQFSTRLLKDFSSSVFRSNAVKLAGMVSEAAISNNAIELQDLFMKSALDSVFKVVLGVELDTMYGTYEEGTRFSNAFDEASAITSYRYVDVFWKIKRLLNIGSEAVLRNNVRVVDQFVYKVIRTKIQQVQKQQDDDSPVVNGDILSRFIELKETNPTYLKDIILSFIIAGKDTTGSTLSWFVYLLCKHPHIQEKIAQEIWEATKVQGGITSEELAARVTEDALEKMQYLHAALTETLRLYPAIPLEGKFCFSDDVLPDGFNVRKGDLMVFCPYAMGRMKYLWGDDAESFKPERWFDHNGIFQHESSFKLTAFQAGPRICLGKEFAYRQMKIFAAVLLGCFKLRLADQKQSAKHRSMLTLQIDGGLHVLASHRLRL